MKKMKTNHNNPLTGTITQKNMGWYTVLTGSGTILCSLSGRLAKSGGAAVAGDRVEITRSGERGQIESILPRRSELSRPAAARPGGRAVEQVFAANIDRMLPVISAASPEPRWALLDRYLVLSEARGIPALVVISKADLIEGSVAAEVTARVEDYRRIGYPVLLVSAVTGAGLDELRAALHGCAAVLLGHSGVGKTSLLNALLPGLDRRTGAVDAASGKGRHTTTDAVLFPLDGGGALLDTPGMREFGLWDVDPEEMDLYFPEMRPYVGQCRFRAGCRHDEEPGCAVRKAVTAGQIHPLRYQSYLKIRMNG